MEEDRRPPFHLLFIVFIFYIFPSLIFFSARHELYFLYVLYRVSRKSEKRYTREAHNRNNAFSSLLKVAPSTILYALNRKKAMSRTYLYVKCVRSGERYIYCLSKSHFIIFKALTPSQAPSMDCC